MNRIGPACPWKLTFSYGRARARPAAGLVRQDRKRRRRPARLRPPRTHERARQPRPVEVRPRKEGGVTAPIAVPMLRVGPRRLCGLRHLIAASLGAGRRHGDRQNLAGQAGPHGGPVSGRQRGRYRRPDHDAEARSGSASHLLLTTGPARAASSEPRRSPARRRMATRSASPRSAPMRSPQASIATCPTIP